MWVRDSNNWYRCEAIWNESTYSTWDICRVDARDKYKAENASEMCLLCTFCDYSSTYPYVGLSLGSTDEQNCQQPFCMCSSDGLMCRVNKS